MEGSFSSALSVSCAQLFQLARHCVDRVHPVPGLWRWRKVLTLRTERRVRRMASQNVAGGRASRNQSRLPCWLGDFSDCAWEASRQHRGKPVQIQEHPRHPIARFSRDRSPAKGLYLPELVEVPLLCAELFGPH